MILNIRGTSGSGKSTAVRALMDLAIATSPVQAGEDFPKKRKNPVGYRLGFPDGQSVFIPGHYETACGGCDTLPSYEVTFDLIKKYHAAGYHVVFEGLLVAHDKKQCLALYAWLGGTGSDKFRILELTESLTVCLESVKARRTARGADPETFKPENTVRRYKEVVRSCEQLNALGIPVHRVSRAECLPKMLELLQLKSLIEVAA